jgi:hypothetical protein
MSGGEDSKNRGRDLTTVYFKRFRRAWSHFGYFWGIDLAIKLNNVGKNWEKIYEENAIRPFWWEKLV